jgi:hypothetical protein
MHAKLQLFITNILKRIEETTRWLCCGAYIFYK